MIAGVPLRYILVASSGVSALSMVGLLFVPRSFAGLLVCQLPGVAAQSVVYLAITSMVSAEVPEEEVTESVIALAVTTSVDSKPVQNTC